MSNETSNNPVEELKGPYFGYNSFHDYYEAVKRSGTRLWNGKTEAEAWAAVEKNLKGGLPADCARMTIEDEKTRPGSKYRAEWYFVMPEARATIPPDLLEKLDRMLVRQ